MHFSDRRCRIDFFLDIQKAMGRGFASRPWPPALPTSWILKLCNGNLRRDTAEKCHTSDGERPSVARPWGRSFCYPFPKGLLGMDFGALQSPHVRHGMVGGRGLAPPPTSTPRASITHELRPYPIDQRMSFTNSSLPLSAARIPASRIAIASMLSARSNVGCSGSPVSR